MKQTVYTVLLSFMVGFGTLLNQRKEENCSVHSEHTKSGLKKWKIGGHLLYKIITTGFYERTSFPI